MGFDITFRRTLSLLAAIALSGVADSSFAAPMRLAIGPYFTSVPYQQLQEDCRLIPDLLTSELGKSDAIELVERERINLLCEEWKITSAGLATREKAAQVGRALGCDWLVSGSLSHINGRNYAWTRLTDVRKGIVLDLHSTAYDGRDLSAAVRSIAAFLSEKRASTDAKHYIALWAISDMNPALKLKREDWGRRIASAIERHCLGAGVGVVEVNAIGALMEERWLETGKLTIPRDQLVQIQPAFWLVDGGWLDATNQIVVGLRMHRVGGPEELVWMTNAPGPSVESGIVKALGKGLARTNEIPASTSKGDADLFASRAQEMEHRQSRFWRQQLPIRTRWDQYKQVLDDYLKADERQRTVTAAYERALLLDPENLLAKHQVGFAYLWEPNRRRWSQGVELLRQVSMGKDPQLARQAKTTLENLETIAEAAKTGAHRPPRPDDWESVQQAYSEDPEDPQAKFEFARQLYFRTEADGGKKAHALMRSIVEGGNAEYTPRAQQALAEWTAMEQARARSVPSAEADPPFDYIACRPYLQENFSKFVPARFEKGSNQRAILQTLPASTAFQYRGKYFYGFRFIIPKEMDGDFEWAFVFAKMAENFVGADGQFYIIPKSGSMEGFKSLRRFGLNRFPELQKQFPRSKTVIYQTLPQASVKAGGEYAIWFAFGEPNPPDIAFALTVDSDEGHRRFGELPLE